MLDYSSSLGQVSCPSCSKLLTVDWTTNPDAVNQTSKTNVKGFRSSSILNRIELANFQTSTKIEALVRMIAIILCTIFVNSLVHALMLIDTSYYLAGVVIYAVYP